MTRVLGVDACKKGWVGIADDLRAYFGVTIEELVVAAEPDGQLAVVAIDIPIGLSTTGPRQADAVVRRLVGRRASSVFGTPVRQALETDDYVEACTASIRVTGKAISRQAFALREKILDVDDWVRRTDRDVIEVHPELCFATMAGGPLPHAKSTWSGAEDRRALLRAAGISVPSDLGYVGSVAAVDDVLDAAAACWTATRFAAGQAVPHPGRDGSRGEDQATIWA
ncbi:DUF429 domain-containing protein [Kribbella sp. NBC_01505]|uniref:DUF429 domain-containing protein n=1 Tax=Kribbella sp. NBC_01505 TaxID=2903580 RepID=UPI00386471F5